MIEKFNEFISKTNKVVESVSRTYVDFCNEIYIILQERGMSDNEIDDYIYYWGGKYLSDYWEQGFSPLDTIEELKIDGKIRWYK